MRSNVYKSAIFKYVRNERSRVFIATAFTTGVKILTGIVLSKVVAVELGPSGLAQLGQFTNFISIALILATGGLTNGIIKYTAETKGGQRRSFIQQSLKLTIITALLASVGVLVTSEWLSSLCFESKEYTPLFRILAAALLFIALNNYLLSLLNGLGLYKAYNLVGTAASVLGMVVSIILIKFLGLFGALFSAILTHVASCFVAIVATRSYWSTMIAAARQRLERAWRRKLFSFSAMALVTACMTPLTQIVIRGVIINKASVDSAGGWEAISRISALYLTVLINVMLVYYLPRLSSLKTNDEIRKEIQSGFKFFTPVVILIAGIVFLFRDIIISVLLTSQFGEIRQYFLPQALGDVFKVLSYLYAYLVIAKAHTRFFIISEIVTSSFWAGMSFVLVPKFGALGAVYAYLATFIGYFALQYLYANYYLLRTNPT